MTTSEVYEKVFSEEFTLVLGDLGLVNEIVDDELAVLSCSGNESFWAPELLGSWGTQVVGSLNSDVFSLCAMILSIIEKTIFREDQSAHLSKEYGKRA